MPCYITDEALEEIPALQAQDPDARTQTLTDVDTSHVSMRRSEWVTEKKLRARRPGRA